MNKEGYPHANLQVSPHTYLAQRATLLLLSSLFSVTLKYVLVNFAGFRVLPSTLMRFTTTVCLFSGAKKTRKNQLCKRKSICNITKIKHYFVTLQRTKNKKHEI